MYSKRGYETTLSTSVCRSVTTFMFTLQNDFLRHQKFPVLLESRSSFYRSSFRACVSAYSSIFNVAFYSTTIPYTASVN